MPYETRVSPQLSYNYLQRDTKGHRRSMERMGFWVAVLIVAAAVSLLLPSRSQALIPDRDIAQYAHHSWKIDDGYFGSNPYSLAQDNDGYLWIGTDHGLYRYDGDRFLRWDPPTGTYLPSSKIEGLLADRDGSLWIGTEAGLAHLSGGHLKNYFEHEGAISGLYQAPDGTVWFGIYSFNKNESKVLCSIQGSRVRCFGDKDGLEQQISEAGIFARDDAGYFWIGASTSVVRWKPLSSPLVLSPKALESNNGNMGAKALVFDQDGSLLVGIGRSGAGLGLQRLRGDKWSTVTAPNFDGSQLAVMTLFKDAHGAVWIGTESDGLYRLYQGKAAHFSSRDGLSGDTVWTIAEDREGTLWVATDKGLDSFHDLPVLAVSTTEFGIPELDNIVTTRDGTLWIGGAGGLFTLNKGVPGFTPRGGNLGHKQVTVIFEDRRGRMWIGLNDTLNLLTRNDFHPVHAPGGRLGMIVSITEDKDGKLWAVSMGPPRHIVRIDPDTLQATPVPDMPQVSKIASDPRGGFWLGLNNGDLDHLDNGKLVAYPLHRGPNTRIQQLMVTAGGDVIAAAPFGLVLIRDGKLSVLDDQGGLHCSNISNFVFDLEDNLWLYSECGLVQLRKSEFQAWQQHPDLKVRTRLFDWMDGIRVLFPPFEGAARSGDGRIWFNNQSVLQVVDPAHITTNLIRPPVHIEAVVADRVSYLPIDGLRLPKLTRDLEIDYTGLSFVAPQKVMFRYMLTGVDQAWQNAGTRRQAFYNNLRPGRYSFRVIACNNDGVWNEEGAHLDFVIAPALYQTIWFRGLCVFAFFTLLWAAYRMRVQQLQEQEEKFRDAVETMPALAFVEDPNGNRTFFNKGWLEYTGLSSEQASGSGWQVAVHPDDLKRVTERWHESQTTGEPLDYEGRLRRGSDGAYRWFQTRARPLRDNRDKIVKWCAVATDIQDRKRAEQLQADLAHTNRVSMLGELAASISHELKQPITAAMANAQASLLWLNRDQPDLDGARRSAEAIVKDEARAVDIIDRLRSLYKKTPPQREPVDVNESGSEMVLLLQSEANEHAVSIRTDLAPDLPKITADRVQLQQVLMNLMLNGIEAMKDTGGVLMVKSQLREDGQIEVSVNDTGPGLPMDKTDQIFDAFFTTKPQGSGMGLAISKSIVESHGGRIWANGDGGRGAAFHFTLPAAPAETNPSVDAA
jgi:PAS domain S-box-containing protein